MDLQVLDCNAAIGRTFGNKIQGGRHITPPDLLAEMDRIGIGEAMVYHVLSHEYDPAYGNAMLSRELDGQQRLHPVWTVLPPHTGEMPEPDELVTQMRHHGIRMARMFPSAAAGSHRFSLQEWCSGSLLGALEAAGIPLAIDFCLFRRAEPPWTELHEAASRHPDLNVILIGIQGRNNRTLFPLLEQHPRIHLETLGYNVHRGIENIVRTFGADRLVLGSGYPSRSLGAARLHVDRADLSTHDRQLIAGDNLRRLLGLRAATERG